MKQYTEEQKELAGEYGIKAFKALNEGNEKLFDSIMNEFTKIKYLWDNQEIKEIK